jgi:hypothetical protein
MNLTLQSLVLALITQELFHVLAEVMSTREKVKRLGAYLAGERYKEMKLKIDSRPKTFMVATVLLLLFTLPLWLLFYKLNLAINTSLVYMVIVSQLTYWAMFIGLDKYHVDIEKLTQKYKK